MYCDGLGFSQLPKPWQSPKSQLRLRCLAHSAHWSAQNGSAQRISSRHWRICPCITLTQTHRPDISWASYLLLVDVNTCLVVTPSSLAHGKFQGKPLLKICLPGRRRVLYLKRWRDGGNPRAGLGARGVKQAMPNMHPKSPRKIGNPFTKMWAKSNLNCWYTQNHAHA